MWQKERTEENVVHVGRHIQTNDWTKERKTGLIESMIALQELNKELERGI